MTNNETGTGTYGRWRYVPGRRVCLGRLRHADTGEEMRGVVRFESPPKGFPYFVLAGGIMLQAWDLGWRPEGLDVPSQAAAGWPGPCAPAKGGRNDLGRWQAFGGDLKRPAPPARTEPRP